MIIQYIPEELIKEILQWAKDDKLTMLNCSLVCKSWYKFAIKLLYETLIFSGDINIWLKNIKERAAAGYTIGIWVKRLIAKNEMTMLTKDQYNDMLSYFPYLQEIDIRDSMWSKYFHLARLSGRNKIYATRIENIIVKTHFMSRTEYQRYYICAYSFRESLKHLQLTYINNGIYLFNDRPGNLLYHLKDFLNITHLSITNKSNQYGDRNMKMIFVMELFPNLVNFSMVTDYNEVKSKSKSIKPEMVVNDSCKNLKSFSLISPTILESHILYFTNYFPKYMRLFNLHLTSTNIFQLFQSVDKEIMQQFGAYLRDSADEVCLQIKDISKSTVAKPILDISLTTNDMNYYYWPFIDLLCGKQRKHHISITVLKQSRNDYGFKFVKHWKSISLSYNVNTEDIIAQLANGTLLHAIHAFIPTQYHVSSKVKNVKSILIDDVEHSFMENRQYITILKSILEVYKENLELVMISCEDRTSQQVTFGGSFMKNRPYCRKFSQLTSDIEQSVVAKTSVSTANNMTFGFIRGERLDKHYLDTIFNLLPSLISVKFIHCKIPGTAEPDHYLVDVQNIVQLDYLLLDVALVIEDCDYLAVKVEYMKTDKTVFYEWERTVYSMNARKRIGAGFKATTLKAIENRMANNLEVSKMTTIHCHNIEHIDISIMDEIIALSILQSNKE